MTYSVLSVDAAAVIANGRQVDLISIHDVGSGWLHVQMGCGGNRYGWYEHKSRRDSFSDEAEWLDYLSDQCIGLVDANMRPLN